MRAVVALASLVCLALGVRGAEAAGPRERVLGLIAEKASLDPQFLGGTEKKVSAKPLRIVSVAPSTTELVFALGAGDRVVGVSRYDEEPPVVKTLPKVGGFIDPNIEAILEQRPDLVVGVPNAGNRPALERIAKLGVPVLVVPGNTFADVFHATRALAPVLGGDAPQRAEKMLGEMQTMLIELATDAQKRAAPKVAFVYGWTPLVLAGPGSFADTMLALLNAKNMVSSGPQYPQYSIEKLIQEQPDVIIDASEVHTQVGTSPWAKFETIPAVKNKRVHAVQAQEVLVPGPRLAKAAQKVAQLLAK